MAGQVAAVVVLAPTLLPVHRIGAVTWPDAAKALTIGAGAALSLSAYLLATREQLLSIAVTLASLYPAIPVLLGVLVLRERCTRRQVVGLIGATVAVVLLSSA